jgi:predicted metal-binding membrane protein
MLPVAKYVRNRLGGEVIAGITRRGGMFLPLMTLLVALAWFVLWVWQRSPYGRYLDHGRWDELGLAANICQGIPAGDVIVPALLYVGGWVLMSAAMMLPTTFPLLDIFRRLTASRSDRRLLMALLISGYLSVWGLFGLAAHLVDIGLYRIVRDSAWLTFNGWALGACVLALAGLFQFSSLKYRCLDQCRTPLSFAISHWRGSHEKRRSFLLGAHHGIYCVGCCWALMLLMFVVGTGNVGWMLVLGAVMAAEKNLSWGRRLSVPLGIGLLGWSAFTVAQGLHASLT